MLLSLDLGRSVVLSLVERNVSELSFSVRLQTQVEVVNDQGSDHWDNHTTKAYQSCGHAPHLILKLLCLVVPLGYIFADFAVFRSNELDYDEAQVVADPKSEHVAPKERFGPSHFLVRCRVSFSLNKVNSAHETENC